MTQLSTTLRNWDSDSHCEQWPPAELHVNVLMQHNSNFTHLMFLNIGYKWSLLSVFRLTWVQSSLTAGFYLFSSVSQILQCVQQTTASVLRLGTEGNTKPLQGSFTLNVKYSNTLSVFCVLYLCIYVFWKRKLCSTSRTHGGSAASDSSDTTKKCIKRQQIWWQSSAVY